MWVLETIDAPDGEARHSYYLLPGCYTAGRTVNVADIYCNHNSISRQHAQIEVKTLADGQDMPDIYLTDSSRYGTLVNGEKLTKGMVKHLTHSKLPLAIAFGFKHTFRLTFRPVRVRTTGTTAFIDLCHSLGFAATANLDKGCTHMLLESPATFSPVLACALLAGTCLVTTDWLHAWEGRKALSADPPDPAGFFPALRQDCLPGGPKPLSKSQLATVESSKARALFQGLTFALLDDVKDEQAVKLLLELCGGKVDDSQAPSTICVSEAELGEPSGSQATTSVPRILAALLKGTTEGLVEIPQKEAADGGNDYIEDSPEPERSPRGRPRGKAAPKAKAADGGLLGQAAPSPKSARKKGKRSREEVEDGLPDEEPEAAERSSGDRRGGAAGAAHPRKRQREGSEEGVQEQKPTVKRVKREGRQREGSQDQDLGSTVVFLPLIVASPKKAKKNDSSSKSGVPNFKAFRCKERQEAPPIIKCVLLDAVSRPDDSFLQAEKERRTQNQKADELFEAKPAGGKAGARKPARKPR